MKKISLILVGEGGGCLIYETVGKVVWAPNIEFVAAVGLLYEKYRINHRKLKQF